MTKAKDGTSATRSYNADDAAVDVGHGDLYSPHRAIKIPINPESAEKSSSEEEEEESKKTMMVVVGLKNLAAVKEKVLEKLAAAAVPSEALENAKHFLEGVAVAAQGLTKDALHRIKTHLVLLLPSLSPAITTKMVDDAEKEANGETDSNENEGSKSKEHQVTGKSPYVSPASSFFGSLAKPFSRL